MADRSARAALEALGQCAWASIHNIGSTASRAATRDTQQELNAERSAYDIRPARQTGIDLWPIAREYSQYAPLVDTPLWLRRLHADGGWRALRSAHHRRTA